MLPELLATDPDHVELIAVRDALARPRAAAAGRAGAPLLRRPSEAEIAAQLGISPGTVKSQARDGLARLREALPDDDVEAQDGALQSRR